MAELEQRVATLERQNRRLGKSRIKRFRNLSVLVALVAMQPLGVATTEDAQLTASDAAADDFFGFSVAISGDTAIVGAVLVDDNGTDSGAAYLAPSQQPFDDLQLP